MAHNITNIDGIDQFLYTSGKPGWHGLGIAIDGGISRHDATEKLPHACGTDTVPLIVTVDGQTFELESKRLTVRRGNDGHIYPVDVVGKAFESAGPEKLFDFIDRLCDSPGGKNIDTLGLLRDGKTLFASVPIPAANFDITVGKVKDGHETHLLCRQHLSSYSVDTMSTSAIRTVCANTEHAALNAAFATVIAFHSVQSQNAMYEKAQEILGIVAKDAVNLQEILQALTTVTPTTDQITESLSQLFTSVDGETTRAASRRENRQATIVEYMESGTGNDRPGIRGTGYGLYNAITQYVSHDRGRESDKKMAAKLGVTLPANAKVFESNMVGTGADILRATPGVLASVLLN